MPYENLKHYNLLNSTLKGPAFQQKSYSAREKEKKERFDKINLLLQGQL